MRDRVLNPSTLRDVQAHAVDEYPSMCCGLVIADYAGNQSVHRCRNIQDELHERDPIRNPQTSTTAFQMSDSQVIGILEDAECSGDRLLGFYYSHMNSEAGFSEQSRSAALYLGEPAFPGVCYIVVSVMGGVARDVKEFIWDARRKDFVECPPDSSAPPESQSAVTVPAVPPPDPVDQIEQRSINSCARNPGTQEKGLLDRFLEHDLVVTIGAVVVFSCALIILAYWPIFIALMLAIGLAASLVYLPMNLINLVRGEVGVGDFLWNLVAAAIAVGFVWLLAS
jgi:proteasome lid subunit RPN8/RPN11